MMPSALADTELVAEEPAEILALEAMEMASSEDVYSCEMTASISGALNVYILQIEVDVECTGYGESTESADAACDIAIASVDACLSMWRKRLF